MTKSPIYTLAMTLLVVAIRAKLVNGIGEDTIRTLQTTTPLLQVSITTTTKPHIPSQAEIIADRLLEVIHDESVFDSSSLNSRIESRMQPNQDERSPVIVNKYPSIKTSSSIVVPDEKKLRMRSKRSSFAARKQSSNISSFAYPKSNTNYDGSGKVSSSTSSVDICDSKMQVITPYFARNSKGKVRVVVNSELMQQAIQVETCRQQATSRCQGDCGCEQKYKWYRLLVRDIAGKSRGLFTDWFLFPSSCVCRCTTNNQKQFLRMVHANN